MLSSRRTQSKQKSDQTYSHESVSTTISEDIRKNLSDVIESIQQTFNRIWLTSPEVFHLKEYYGLMTDEEDRSGRGFVSVKSMLDNFENYKSVDDIGENFVIMRKAWRVGLKGKAKDDFIEGYILCLRLMEAHFVAAFMLKQSHHINQYNVSDLQIIQDVDINKDLSSLTEDVIKNFKTHLTKHIKTSQSKKLKDKLEISVMDLNQEVQGFNDCLGKWKKEESKFYEGVMQDSSCSLDSLLKDALRLEKLAFERNSLVDQQKTLNNRSGRLLQQNTQAVKRFNLDSTEEKISSPRMDFSEIKAFQPNVEVLRTTKASIESIKQYNACLIERLKSQKYLKGLIVHNDEYPQGLRQDIIDFQHGRSWLYFNNAKISATDVMCRAEFDKLVALPNVKVGTEEFKEKHVQLDKLLEQQKRVTDDLERVYGQLHEKVDRAISCKVAVAMYEEILNEYCGELTQAATAFDEMDTIQIDRLSNTKQNLEDKWKQLFENEQAQDQVKEKKIKLQQQLIHSTKEEQDEVSKALEILSQKEKLYYSGLTSSIVPTVIEDDIAQSFEKNRQPIANHAEDRHWHSGFTDKPWKRAAILTVGLIVLSCTMAGLLAGFSLGIMLVAGTVGLGISCVSMLAAKYFRGSTQNEKQQTKGLVDAQIEEHFLRINEPVGRSSTRSMPFKPVTSSLASFYGDIVEKEPSCFGRFFSCASGHGKPIEPTKRDFALGM